MYQINQLQLRVIIKPPSPLSNLKMTLVYCYQRLLATNHCHQKAHIVVSVLLLAFVNKQSTHSIYLLPVKPALFDILCQPLSLSFFVTQRAVLVCAMEMVGALWVTVAGTVCASWAGGALAVTPLWKLPAVMSRTTMEVKSQTAHSFAFWQASTGTDS